MASVSGSVLFTSTAASSGGTGVSNIPIVLQNTTSNVGIVVLTSATGTYQFNNVTNGSYRIVEAFGTLGGTVSPVDFASAIVINQPTPKDPDVSAINSPPTDTNKIYSLSPNTIFITVSGTDITGKDFRDAPSRNIPKTINDINYIGSNLITVADNGSFGSYTDGTAKDSSPSSNPYSGVSSFTYVQYSSFSTDNTSSILNIGTRDLFSAWWNMADYTTGDETGRYMIVGGASTTVAFKQTITTKVNTNYLLTFWVANIVDPSKSKATLPNLDLKLSTLGGAVVTSAISGSLSETAIPTWVQIAKVLNSGNNTSLNLTFSLSSSTAFGNDFALDDITFYEMSVNYNILSLVKTVDNNYATIGDILTYTTVITNTGYSTANNVVFMDTIPSGASFITGSVLVNGVTIPSANPALPGFNIGSSIIGASTSTVLFKVKVDTIPIGNILSNNSLVSFDFTPIQGESTYSSSIISNTAITTINYGSIYAVQYANKTNVGLGDTLIYTIMAKNIGNITVNNATLTGTIPSGTGYSENSLDYNGTNMIGAVPTLFDLGTFMVNEVKTITYKVQVTTIPSISNITNSATISFNYLINPSIPAGRNISVNTAIITNYLKYPILNVVKSINKDYFIPGETAIYTIVINNTGSATAKNIIIQDTIPDEVTFITNSVYINGTLTTATPSILNIGSIAIGGRSTVTFKVKINS